MEFGSRHDNVTSRQSRAAIRSTRIEARLSNWIGAVGVVAVTVAMVLAPHSSRAQLTPEESWAACDNAFQPVEPIIAGCTAFINSGNELFRALAYGNRGLAYARQPNVEVAFADFSEAIRIDPGLTFALIGRGKIFASRGDTDNAIADFNAATLASPDFEDSYYERGLVYLDMANLDQAIADFSKAIELGKTNDRELWSAPAFAARSKAYVAKGDSANADADMAEASRLDPVRFPTAPIAEAAPTDIPTAAPLEEPLPPLVSESPVPDAVVEPLDYAALLQSSLVPLAIATGFGLALFLLWLLIGRRKPAIGPHVIELPGNDLDPLERRFARILPMGVWAVSLAQLTGGIGTVGGVASMVAMAAWLASSPGGDLGGAPQTAAASWTTWLVLLLAGPVGLAGLSMWNLLLGSVPRSVSRVGGLPLLLFVVLGLVLAPIGALMGLSALSHFDNPLSIAAFVVLTIAAAAISIIYSIGMLRGALSIILSRDVSVEIMRATPSSRSFMRRVLAQIWGLPPLFEYAARPWPRFMAIILASIASGFFIACATLLVLFGMQAVVNALASSAALCGEAGCSELLVTAVIAVPLLVIVIPAAFFAIGGLLQRGVQRLVRFSLEQLQRTDPRPPILFLRAFGDDQVALPLEKFSLFGRLLQLGRMQRDLDNLLLEEVTPYGPHVALGNPQDPFPPYGAARGYFENKDWRQAVADLVRRCRLILLCVDPTDGVWWEVRHIAEQGLIGKTLFLVHPKHRSEPHNSRLMARLAHTLGIGNTLIEALSARPPPKPKAKNAAPSILGFFVTEENRIQLIYSSTFTRLAYLLAVRLFIRSRLGIAPTPLP